MPIKELLLLTALMLAWAGIRSAVITRPTIMLITILIFGIVNKTFVEILLDFRLINYRSHPLPSRQQQRGLPGQPLGWGLRNRGAILVLYH